MSAYRPTYDDEVSMGDWLADETQVAPTGSPDADPPAAPSAPPIAPPSPALGYAQSDRPVLGEEEPYSEARQRERYGGLNWGAGLFGWLVVVALGVVLACVLAAGVSALGMTDQVLTMDPQQAPGVETLAVAGTLLGILLVAHYAGGYVAGRMSRFDGGRQGVAVWLISLLLGGAGAGIGLLTGARYDALQQVGQAVPSLPAGAAPLTGVIASVAVLLTTLIVAVVGGKVGCRYHRKVDDAAYL